MFKFANPFSQQLTVEILLTLGKPKSAYTFQIPSLTHTWVILHFFPNNVLLVRGAEELLVSHLFCLCGKVKITLRTCTDFLAITILSQSAVGGG